MAEPVLQGIVSQGDTRVIVLPSSLEGETDDAEIENPASAASTDPARSGIKVDYDEQDSDEGEFDIDESFLANSVLTSSSHPPRFGPTPLTSPLSTSSKQRQFFPLDEAAESLGPDRQEPPRLTPVPLQHPVASQLLTPTPDHEEDDLPRAYLSSSDLGRIGMFSGDWIVLRSVGGNASRLAKVFASDGLLDADSGTASAG